MPAKKYIAVVGGAGYIGSHMVRMLLDHGYSPVVFDNLRTGHRRFVPGGVPFVKGNLDRPTDIQRLFERYPTRAVMHFAAASIVPESVRNPLLYYHNNVSACIHLAQVMIDFKIREIVFSSTAAVYGHPKKVPIPETARLAPVNAYGHTKRMIEQILEDVAFAHHLRYVFLRYFNVAGAHPSGKIGEEHRPETHLVPNILKSLKRSKNRFFLFGDDYPTRDGTCIRDYIHVQDLCAAHLLALRHLDNKKDSDVFNLGSGKGYTVRQVIDMVEQVTGQPVQYTVKPGREGDPVKLVASSRKARDVLGWMPTHSLKDMIASAWQWEQNRSA
ncbi:MAG: UDP-glucose 4-epimerase GalE [Candidatus Omnitrophica bacterium]|nr:UDP-glucose 4-epimerase GalE [Candidatus Omnitrophota bacterium]